MKFPSTSASLLAPNDGSYSVQWTTVGWHAQAEQAASLRGECYQGGGSCTTSSTFEDDGRENLYFTGQYMEQGGGAFDGSVWGEDYSMGDYY